MGGKRESDNERRAKSEKRSKEWRGRVCRITGVPTFLPTHTYLPAYTYLPTYLTTNTYDESLSLGVASAERDREREGER